MLLERGIEEVEHVGEVDAAHRCLIAAPCAWPYPALPRGLQNTTA